MAIGWGVTAALHLAWGSPLGLPSGEELRASLTDVGIEAVSVSPSRYQTWGVAHYDVVTENDEPLTVSLYGRDAASAELLRKLYRFILYRNSGPALSLTRIHPARRASDPSGAPVGHAAPGTRGTEALELEPGPRGGGFPDRRVGAHRGAHQCLPLHQHDPQCTVGLGGRHGPSLLVRLPRGSHLKRGKRSGLTPPRTCGRTRVGKLVQRLLAGGNVAVIATEVRFYQQQGFDSTAAVTSSALVNVSSLLVKVLLFLLAIPFAWSSFHFGKSLHAGNHAGILWTLLAVVVVIGVVLTAMFAVPRWRHLVAEKLRPKLSSVIDDFKTLATQPVKLVELFGGQVASQLLIIIALGAALHAFDAHLSLAALVIASTMAGVLASASPAGGGMGVAEAGLILALTAAGIPSASGHRCRLRPAPLHCVPSTDCRLVHTDVDETEGIPLVRGPRVACFAECVRVGGSATPLSDGRIAARSTRALAQEAPETGQEAPAGAGLRPLHGGWSALLAPRRPPDPRPREGGTQCAAPQASGPARPLDPARPGRRRPEQKG